MCIKFDILRSLVVAAVLAPGTSMTCAATEDLEFNSITSTYEGGYFSTTTICQVDTTLSELNKVIDEVYAGMKKGPTKTMPWLWQNLGHRKSVEGDVTIWEKSCDYNPSTNSYVLGMGIKMQVEDEPITFTVAGRLLHNSEEANHWVELLVTERVKILDAGDFLVTSVTLPGNKPGVKVVAKFKFGWFINLFITQSRYRSIIEWRTQGVAKNIKKRAEHDRTKNY